MLTCHLQFKVKSETEFPFLMYRLFVKVKHLPHLSTVSISLVKFIHILTAFYHLRKRLVLYTDLLIDALEYAQAEQKNKLNFFSDANVLKKELP